MPLDLLAVESLKLRLETERPVVRRGGASSWEIAHALQPIRLLGAKTWIQRSLFSSRLLGRENKVEAEERRGKMCPGGARFTSRCPSRVSTSLWPSGTRGRLMVRFGRK